MTDPQLEIDNSWAESPPDCHFYTVYRSVNKSKQTQSMPTEHKPILT